MKKLLLVLSTIIFTCIGNGLTGQSQPVGWASLNGGVTGGLGGDVVTVDNRAEFIAYVSFNDDPMTILIQDTIELELYERVKVRSNKTIFGFTENAMIRYGGLEIEGNNVIVRNLIIGDFYDGDWSGTTHSTDCMTIFGQNIWIDHCWMWEGADGLLDIRSGNGNIADYVTVSYCRFSSHNKVTLVGSSDNSTQDRDHLRVTFHHCWYDGTVGNGLHQRNPRVRFGDVHVFNNYYEAIGSYCVAARIESDIVVENTYFRDCPDPHIIDDWGEGLEDPDLVAIDNVYEICSGSQTTNGEAWVPVDFYEYEVTPVMEIPALVMSEAGPFNPTGNIAPTAVNDTIDYSNMTGGLNIFVTENDLDPDSDDLRIAQIESMTAGIGFVKENKIIYAPQANGTGVDTITYTVVDTEGGIDTGYVLIFHDGLNSINEVEGNSDKLHVFPNPADDLAVLEVLLSDNSSIKIEVLDIDGRVILRTEDMVHFEGKKFTMDTASLESGMYLIIVDNGLQKYSKKLMVTH
ncbi:MAG: T9SS C-terminal target domain-containing protein [Bacteroidetes bacterium]|nr:MAG: T9SS C-terminal target domain-containing protein [Bacteroidota bacterium]